MQTVGGAFSAMIAVLGLFWGGATVVELGWDKVINPEGGQSFDWLLRVERMAQGDPRWADDRLGPTAESLGAEGCAVASAAMSLRALGIDTDVGRLNAFADRIGGFTPNGFLYWEAGAALDPQRICHIYEGPASHRLIDANLRRGNPVIAKLQIPGRRQTHFVVIAGKRGQDYLIQDPGSGGVREYYPLREFGSPLLGIRYYGRR